MVLKRPYAFLIKHFMLIHIILTSAMVYVCVRFNNSFTFIKEYINNTASISMADTYINLGMFLSIFIILGISFVIFWLMKYKNKPKLLYLFNMILYIVLLILTIILASTFGSLDEVVLDSKTIRLFRDVVRIVIYVQYVFIALMVVRTLGFDVKKFNFASDIQDIAIDSEDSEEVEVTIGLDFNKIKRSVRRYLRELKYYYQENKQIILIILGIFVFVVGVNLVKNILITNKVYGQNQIVTSTYFKMNVTNSYTTKLKYDGTDISVNNKTYLILKIDVQCLYDDKYELDMSDFMLEIKDKYYLPTKKYYQYFTDIGFGYDNQKLNYSNNESYILVFLVDDDMINMNKVLKYHEGYRYANKKYISSDKMISIKSINLDDTTVISTTNINDKLHYSNTVIGEGNLLIKDYEFANRFDYNASNIVIAGYNKTILRLGIESDIKEYNNYEFFNNFINLYSVKDNQTKKIEFKNKTPKVADDNVYLEVDKSVEETDSIYLEIRIRNNIYKYVIK